MAVSFSDPDVADARRPLPEIGRKEFAADRERIAARGNARETMTRTAALIVLAVLGPACDPEPTADPVWGSWEARSEGCNARTQLEIDEDYNGEGRVVFDDCSVCEVRLDVAAVGDDAYELEVDGVSCEGTIDLDCTLERELECEDAVGTRYYFERD